MTKENMKRLYDHYVATGNTEEAKKILAITKKEYDKFADSKEPEKETKSKKDK